MMGFVGASLGFPAVVFSFALVVVIGYWVLVLLGGLGIDVLDGDDGSDLLDGLGLGGVPATVVLSLMIAVAWFVSLAGTVLLDRADVPGPVLALLAVAVLLVALLCAWAVARLVVLPLRRILRAGPEPSRADFVGRTCVVRTGRVATDFGQAEVAAADGSSAIVQVRQSGSDPLTAGTTALIYDYDPDGEFFWVTALPQGVE
jgi:Ca2+-binding RTX toxin-like protein